MASLAAQYIGMFRYFSFDINMVDTEYYDPSFFTVRVRVASYTTLMIHWNCHIIASYSYPQSYVYDFAHFLERNEVKQKFQQILSCLNKVDLMNVVE